MCLGAKVMVHAGDSFISRYGMFADGMGSSPTNLTYRHLIRLAFLFHFILSPGFREESETLQVHFVICHIQAGSDGGGRDRHL